MTKTYLMMFFGLTLLITSFNTVQAQSTNSCYSRSGTISANIQIFYADKVDEPVVFDAGNSTGTGDFFKEPIEWDFGDGFKAKMCRSTHVYRNAGTYTVTLKVKDNQGNLSTASTTVAVNDIPSASGNNLLTVVTNGSGNGVTTFNTVQEAVDKAATINGLGTVEIILPAGATFSENIELKVPQGNNYITLKSSALNNLSRGQRVNRSTLSSFATIKSPLNNANISALRTELKSPTGGQCNTSQTCQPAHHYRLQGIQFTVSPGTLPNGVYENIVALGTDDPSQNQVSEQAHHFILDRSLIFSDYYSATTNPNPQRVKNGMELNATNVSVLDSDISGISSEDGAIEAHAIGGYNSLGVWGIVNNYFESSHIPIIFGGAEPSVPNATATYVEFRRNRCHKPLEMRNLPYAHRWFAKVNFEIKSGKNWIIEENLFDGNWIGNDQRWNVNFNATGEASPIYPDIVTIQDIQFTNNIIKQGPRGMLLGRGVGPGIQSSPFPARYLIANNLIAEVGGSQYGCNLSDPACNSASEEGTEGQGFTISFTPTDLIIRHNTVVDRWGILETDSPNLTPIVLKDNIMNHGVAPYGGGYGWGIKGSGVNSGIPTFNQFFPNSEVIKNLIADIAFNPYPNPTQNYYCNSLDNPPVCNPNIDAHFVNRNAENYRISSSSPGKNGASDGLDVGANIDKIDIVSTNAVSGNWGNTSANQTPYPGPSAPTIPVTLEVEKFDNGGEGISYHENFGNTGSGTYRSGETVDIQYRPGEASNNYAVTEAAAGEWLEYTITVPFTRKYDIGVRYASEFNNGTFHIEDCGNDPNNQNCLGVNLTGTMTANSTGYWGNFRTITTRSVQLAAGIHVLRLKMDTNSPDGCGCIVANFDAILFKPILFDYDNDGKSDVSVFRPANGNWYLNRSKDGFTVVNFGLSSDIIAPADFDGDGKTDIAVWGTLTGNWYILKSSNSQTTGTQFGESGDIPVQADYDNDGKADIAVWRPSTGTWYIHNINNTTYTIIQFGQNLDKPAVGDYDGDGKSDLAVYRPSTGVWHILKSSNSNYSTTQFGVSTDKIAPADYDGDGKTDIAVYRPSTGTWYIAKSSGGIASIQFGLNDDIPVPGDYDGDGKVDFAVFRPSNGTWYLQRSLLGFTSIGFGQNGDVPTQSTYVR